MNRHRSSDVIVAPTPRGPFTVKRYDAPTYALMNTNTVNTAVSTILKREVASIDDTQAPGRATKEVEHTKVSYEAVEGNNSVEESLTTSPRKRYVSTGPGHHWYSWGTATYPSKIDLDLKEVLPLTFAVSEDEIVLRAIDKFNNENRVDTLLNVIEANQLIGTLGLVGKFLRVKKELSQRHKWRSIRSLITGGYLAYSFGIAPLVSDLQTISREQAKMALMINKYMENLGKPYSVYYKVDGGCQLTASHGSRLQNMSTHATYRRRYEVQPQAICRVRGVDTNRYASDALNKLQFILSRFGSTGPASLGWELIPFSFVVDWFVDLSRVFSFLDGALTGRAKTIQDISLSKKAVICVDEIFHPNSSWSSDWDGIPTVFHKVSYYHRKPIVRPPWVAFSGKFGKKQVLLAGALLHQIVANLLNKRRIAR